MLAFLFISFNYLKDSKTLQSSIPVSEALN